MLIVSMDMNLSKLWEVMKDRGAWCAVVYEVTKSQTRLDKKNIKLSTNVSFEKLDLEDAE